jgi:hypothetical protein
MRYSGSRLVREISAMVSEKDEAYHGPGKALRGWKNWVCTMRKVRAASRTMGTRAPSCGRDSSESSMARWVFGPRQKRRAFEKARQSWDGEVLGDIDTIDTFLNLVCYTIQGSVHHTWVAPIQDSKHQVDLLQQSQCWEMSPPLMAWVCH